MGPDKYKDCTMKVVSLDIGDVFIKKYDITHYNIDLNKITSEHKDGILSVFLPKKPDDTKGQNFKVKISQHKKRGCKSSFFMFFCSRLLVWSVRFHRILVLGYDRK